MIAVTVIALAAVLGVCAQIVAELHDDPHLRFRRREALVRIRSAPGGRPVERGDARTGRLRPPPRGPVRARSHRPLSASSGGAGRVGVIPASTRPRSQQPTGSKP